MKLHEVLLRATTGKIKWWQPAELMGISVRQMRRWRKQQPRTGEFDFSIGADKVHELFKLEPVVLMKAQQEEQGVVRNNILRLRIAREIVNFGHESTA